MMTSAMKAAMIVRMYSLRETGLNKAAMGLICSSFTFQGSYTEDIAF